MWGACNIKYIDISKTCPTLRHMLILKCKVSHLLFTKYFPYVITENL